MVQEPTVESEKSLGWDISLGGDISIGWGRSLAGDISLGGDRYLRGDRRLGGAGTWGEGVGRSRKETKGMSKGRE